MPNAYKLGIFKLIDVAENALTHALTMQEMYEEDLEPAQYDDVHAKHQRLMSEEFQTVRDSVENAQQFEKAVGSIQRDHPKSLSAA